MQKVFFLQVAQSSGPLYTTHEGSHLIFFDLKQGEEFYAQNIFCFGGGRGACTRSQQNDCGFSEHHSVTARPDLRLKFLRRRIPEGRISI